jgi:Flp pilus assembly protein CpaB
MKGGKFIGLMAAVAAFVLLFAWGYINTPQYTIVLAAREDLPAGTFLAEISEKKLVEVKIAADETNVAMYLTGEQYQILAAKGAYLTENIHQNEFLRTMAVAYSGNPEQSRRAALGMTDPNLRDTILPFEYLPTGILPGDCVDLAIVTSEIRNLSGGSAMLSPLADTGPSSAEDTRTADSNPQAGPPAATETPLPTLTPTPSILLPLGKYVVQCARVVSVIHQTEMVSQAGGQTELVTGKAIALELIIPQESAEMVAMASQAGVLRVFLRPLSAEDKARSPSVGASMQDVLDLFYADRERLSKITPSATPTASRTPLPTHSQS